MSVIEPQGLKGLKGLNFNDLTNEEQYKYMHSIGDRLKGYSSATERKNKAAIIYNNQKFRDTFGNEMFDQLKGGKEAYDYRNQLLKDKVVSDEFMKRYSKGLGADFKKYFGQLLNPATGQRIGGMSTDGLIKVLESDYLSPVEFEDNWKKQSDALRGISRDSKGKAIFNPFHNIGGLSQALGTAENTGEAAKERSRRRNDRILERIYNDDADVIASKLSDQVATAYFHPSIMNLSDREVVSAFMKAITPSKTNLGIPEYASHYGAVKGEGISEEMVGFSVDDMREVLAKKAVYEQHMSPEMAMTALNNEAKRYIHDHQGFDKKALMFGKDVLIASTSYTADKINGFYNMGLMAADGLSKKGIIDTPTVYIDDQNNILPLDDKRVVRNRNGEMGYRGKDGQFHTVYARKIDRTTLHNMGKNIGVLDSAGSDDDSYLNPQDWTLREQFGVWDKDVAKQYEKLGSSPYKVAYNPDDDRDLLYESAKMMSFGLADMGSQLIPFGIGAAGKALSTANHVGRVIRNLGRVTNVASKFLTAETKIGQIAQGAAGALGIAEAYQRGTFQETLAQNMSNLEQKVADKSRKEIEELYQNNADYRKAVDAQADARAAVMKAEYMTSLNQDGKSQIVDEKKLDEYFKTNAQNAILEEAVQNRIKENKSTEEYSSLQEEAINSAGFAATNTFWPEAIKYGLVNTIGFRKYLYTAPTSVTQKAMRNFKGLKEITTSAGRKRLATDIGKTLTRAEKWKQFGKAAGSQMWGGAWTNGSDDMMVDAAERINEDSFNRYLHDYETGESTADTYGFVDGLFSYWNGLQNSLGQDTTLEAGIVGALGSAFSGNLHFTNIASLATKEGREAFKNNFQQRYKRDADGMMIRGEDGKAETENISWRDNWRDRLAFFIQNGVLNTYYEKKQELRNLQAHADFVNNILDDLDDFKGIESLISSDIGRENALNIGDEKTMRFVQAFNAINTLENLGKDEKDPSTLSSVVMQHKNMMERASKLGTEESDMSEEEITNLLGQYYSNNPGLAQSEENNQIALQNIAQNARKLQEAHQAFNEAEKSIQSLEKDKGISILPSVRFKMKLSQALDGHWRDRLQKMKDEIGDASTAPMAEGETLIASVGGKRKADKQLKDFAAQEAILLPIVSHAVSEQQNMLEKYKKAQQALREAEDSEDSNAILQAQKALKEAKDNYDEAVEERMFREDMLSNAREKQQRLQEAVDAWEKGTKSKVLSADEIMSLDPVTRAKMLRELEVNPLTGEREADPYNATQRKQIETLKARLKAQDKTGDPLQKIQDIALLTQRIAQNEDAYHRISRNPDAAAVQLDKQWKKSARKAVQLIDQRNAETLAKYITEIDRATVASMPGITLKDMGDYIYKTLRTKNSKLLDIIDNEGLLSPYSTELQKAKEWAHITDDIDAVVSNMGKDEAQDAVFRSVIDGIIEPATTKEEIINNLEKEIDNTEDSQRQQDFEELLDGLQKLGYQRGATVIENRKQKREREEAQRKAEEERKQKLEAAVKEAEAKKAAEDAKRKAEEEEKRKKNDNGTSDTDFSDSEFKEQETGTIQLPPSIDAGLDSLSGKSAGEPASTVVEGAAVKQQPVEPKDSYVTSEVSEKNGIKTTKFTKYRTVKSGKVKPITGMGGLKIDGSTISKESLDNAGEYDEIRLAELREDSNGNMAGTIWAKDSEGMWIQFEVKFDKDPRKTSSSNSSNIDEIVDLWKIYTSLGTKDIPKTLNNIGYQMTEIREAEEAFNKKYPNGVPELSEEEAKELAKTLGIQQNADSSVSGTMEVHDEVLGDVIQGQTPSLEEQVTEAQREGQGEVQDVATLPDVIMENERGEENIETSPTSLSGNAMSEYEPRALEEHRLVHKRGEKEGDSMNRFYEWMENAGIKLQNIIDEELPQIMIQNPHTPIRFMRVRPEKNSTHDDYMQSHLMLVVDYTGDVEKLHNEDNGGIITSDGKKYLIVGTVGYGKTGKNVDKFNLWKLLMDNYAPNSHKLKVKAWDWFKQDAHKSERFYVHPDFHTEIVQGSMIPGYLIRQNLTDETEKERSIKELLKDRNPYGYKLTNLPWGIQTDSGFWTCKTGYKEVMMPQYEVSNSGRVFVLVPAGNGKLVPAKIEPLHYSDGMNEDGVIVDAEALNRDSKLWHKIQDLLNQVISPNYNDRVTAISALSSLLYFAPKDKGNKTILVGANESDNRVTVVNGNQKTTFFLDLNFDRGAFFKAVREMNPRINVTPSALNSNERLEELEEIGALKTDIAKLGTCGVSYSIYGIDSDGKMIIPDKPISNSQVGAENSLDKNVTEFRYLYGSNYKYDSSTGVYTKNGVPVTGDNMIDYAYKIGTLQVLPIKQEGLWKYYIITTGEHPEVVKQNNVGRIEKLSEEEARKIIDEEVKRVEEEKRIAAMEAALAEAEQNEEQEGDLVVDDNGSFDFFDSEGETEQGDATIENGKEVKDIQETSHITPSAEGGGKENKSRTFSQLWRSMDMDKVLDVLKQKDWNDVPMDNMRELKRYLEEKGMTDLDNISSSEADFKAWLQKLKCL